MMAAIGALYCLIAIVLGAWLSHGTSLSEATLKSVEIAVQYQFWHGLALLIFTSLKLSPKAKGVCSLGVAFGCLLFSGGIYTKALIGFTSLGWVTPIGGGLMIISWAYLSFALLKERHA